jgi:2,5-dioxopentanoate dehydrogenase
VLLGSGQFCTNPGLAVLVDAPVSSAFLKTAGELLGAAPAGTMAHAGIKAAFDRDIAEVARLPGVSIAARAQANGAHVETAAHAALLLTDARTYMASARLRAEIYGPASVAVRCASRLEMLQLARGLHGHLTATVHGSERDLEEFPELVAVLRRKAGRLVFNGFPTGVEVGHAMHHGGPYPATTDARETSVGSAAILRFARPVCYQDFPQSALPAELRDDNPLGIWRMVDGAFTKDAV